MDDDRVVHILKEQQGTDVIVKCGVGFKKTSKTDRGTFWWRDVTCPGCIEYLSKNATCAEHFNVEEDIW